MTIMPRPPLIRFGAIHGFMRNGVTQVAFTCTREYSSAAAVGEGDVKGEGAREKGGLYTIEINGVSPCNGPGVWILVACTEFKVLP